MSESNFQTVLDGAHAGKTPVLDVCKSYNEADPVPIITDEQFNNKLFFTKYFSTELCEILNQWFTDGTLEDDQQEIFRVATQFLLKLVKAEPNSQQWFNQQTEIINFTEKCLNEISSYGYYIGIGGHEDPNLESFSQLIEAFEKVHCQDLLDELTRCVTCRFYIDALYQLSYTNDLAFTVTQKFLLVICPNYILTCDMNKTYSLKIVNKMLGAYDDIFADFLPHIKEWSVPMILSLLYPIQFTLKSIRSLSFEQKKLVYDVCLSILLNEATNVGEMKTGQAELVRTSLSLLIEIMRSDQDLANELKNRSEKKSELIDVLNNLAKDKSDDPIRLKATALVSLLMPEEEFLQQNSAEEVTEIFVKNLTDAIEEGTDREIHQTLSGLRDLVQNDEVKQELVKQNGLTPIMEYAKESKNDPLPLEIVYAMTFNADAKKVINQDQKFIDHVKTLCESERRDVSKMAHGIVWKLEGEEKFKTNKQEQSETDKQEKPSETTTETSAEKTTKHDMMISYCWAQKELCHKINDRLEKDGYKVWLDRDEMHGSIIERMAEAIEQARFVIICMSSNYKNSINCKAEAEYAFSRKSKIIPLMVEPNYKADGWLGFLAGSKIYIDFADKENEEFDAAYEGLIAELERQGLKDPDDDENHEKKHETSTESKPKEPEEKKEPEKVPEPPHIQTREYLNVGPPTMWTDENVKEFLTDNQLEQLIPVCESMDGETLMEFHRSCETVPDKVFALVNHPKAEHPVRLNTFFKFITRLRKHIPPKQPRKVQFQYNFIYPSSNTPSMNGTK